MVNARGSTLLLPQTAEAESSERQAARRRASTAKRPNRALVRYDDAGFSARTVAADPRFFIGQVQANPVLARV